MDSLETELLLRDVEHYGYRLVHPGKDPEAILRQMLSANDGRVLEGFPVVLTSVLMTDESLDLHRLEESLPTLVKKRFRILAAATYLFLFWVPESDRARKQLHKYLKDREPTVIESVKTKLFEQHKINVGDSVILDEQRLERTYKNYVLDRFMSAKESFTQKLENQRNVVFNDALAELFTARQGELITKMLKQETLTKTEREYYSRVVKKRLKALRNGDLQTMAANLLGI